MGNWLTSSKAALADTRLFVQRAYPRYADVIDRGFREDPAFRDLCEDYQQCAIALEDNRRYRGGESIERIAEYEQLLGELANDIEVWLGEPHKE